MAVRVGIPRGLLYYYYGEVWQDFFRRLGAEAVVSGETSQATIDRGGVIDEVCLPVKVAAGHACELAKQVDYLFMPRLVSMAARQYTCPKIIGLPDMIRSNIKRLPPLLDVTIDLRKGRYDLYRAVISMGKVLGRNPLASLFAWQQAWSRYAPSGGKGGPESTGLLNIALIGHPYMIYDRQVSMDILQRLGSLGANVITPDSVEQAAAAIAVRRLPKQIFWHYCDRLVGAALALMYSLQQIDGAIFLTSFACGPDSLMGEILKWHAHSLNIPFLLLTVDEHTAEAGFVTRLEAFTDMLRRGGG